MGPLGINFNEILIKSIHFIQENTFENVVCEMASISSRPQCVKSLPNMACDCLAQCPGTRAVTLVP